MTNAIDAKPREFFFFFLQDNLEFPSHTRFLTSDIPPSVR